MTAGPAAFGRSAPPLRQDSTQPGPRRGREGLCVSRKGPPPFKCARCLFRALEWRRGQAGGAGVQRALVASTRGLFQRVPS